MQRHLRVEACGPGEQWQRDQIRGVVRMVVGQEDVAQSAKGQPRQHHLAPHAVAAVHHVDGAADDERLRRRRARALGGRPAGGAEQDELLARRGRGQEGEQQEDGDHRDGDHPTGGVRHRK